MSVIMIFKFLEDHKIQFKEIKELQDCISKIKKRKTNIVNLGSEKRTLSFVHFFKKQRNFNIMQYHKKK